MKYYDMIIGASDDGLLGGCEIAVQTMNVSIGANESIMRGMLLCSDNGKIFTTVGSNSDANKILVIAAEDCTADSVGGVVSAYQSGKINRSQVVLGGGSIEAFEEALRKENIILTDKVVVE